jgi:protein-L-isoaspartate(D-aspartate) O-methyltransferase
MTITQDRPGQDRTASQTARRAMIDSQLRTSGVNEAWVLEAMNAIPREDFVPENARAAAYIDRAVPLGNNRHLAAPIVHARMLAEARPTAADSVLIVSGNGAYLAALVRPLAGSLEVRDPADAATLNKGAYSLILIDGAAEALPAAIASALAEDGRIVGGLVERGVTRLAVGRAAADAIAWLPVADLGIPILAEFAAPRPWTF